MTSRLKEDEKNERIIRGLLKLPANRRCINCNNLGPQYVCTTFLTFICTTCSGIHREFTHRVKSVSMAKFTPQEVTSLQSGGNERAKEIYFKELDSHRLPDSSNVDRLRDFIKHVYVDKRYTGERSSDRTPPRVKMGEEETNEHRRTNSYGSGSRSPPYEDTYDRCYSDRPSPGYEKDNQRTSDHGRSPVRSVHGVVNDWRREDRFGNGRRSEDGRSPIGDSRGRSPDSQKDLNVSSPPVIRPVKDILGENTSPLLVIEPPKVISGKVSHGFPHTQISAEHADDHDRRLRPMQTDFFREVSLFNAHFDSQLESSRWAQFLPEYLRPGNLENYLKQTKKPQLFGNNFWWASQASSVQDCDSRLATMNQKKMPIVPDGQQDLQSSKPCSRRIDHIRYSRDQLLQLREVKTVSEAIMKIKQGMEVEFLGVKQMIEHRAIGADSSGTKKENGLTLKEKKEEKKGVSEKKKRGMSDERRAKKKMKERKKRAEKNRKLGVKRLKIQPIVKQKPVSHCRHYMHGRCYEGEKCKFSHDVVPLTKSKPCCHFSRQACMKGDDCPFDHQLSKYPCNNYVSTGYCSRGENCLFSHEITPKQDSVSPLGAIKPEAKSLNPCPNSGSIQQVKNSFASGSIPTPEIGKAAEERKGLSSGNFPLDASAKYKQANLSQKFHFVFESGAPTSGGSSKGTPASLTMSSAQPYTVESTKDNSWASKGNLLTKTPKGLTFLNTGNSQRSDSGNGVLSNQDNVSNHDEAKKQSSFPTVGNSSLAGDSNQKPNVGPLKFSGSSSPFLNRLDNAQVKNTSSSGQRSLLATLGFASKYDSGSKRHPFIATPASPIKNAGLTSSSTSDTSHKKPANPVET